MRLDKAFHLRGNSFKLITADSDIIIIVYNQKQVRLLLTKTNNLINHNFNLYKTNCNLISTSSLYDVIISQPFDPNIVTATVFTIKVQRHRVSVRLLNQVNVDHSVRLF